MLINVLSGNGRKECFINDLFANNRLQCGNIIFYVESIKRVGFIVWEYAPSSRRLD